ncbi:MAG: hypothetical protein N2C14_25130, partial [Planctomycetales bacterium]
MSANRPADLQQLKHKIQEDLLTEADLGYLGGVRPFDEFCADVALAIHELIGIGPFNITRSELTWLTLEILEDMNRREAAR